VRSRKAHGHTGFATTSTTPLPHVDARLAGQSQLRAVLVLVPLPVAIGPRFPPQVLAQVRLELKDWNMPRAYGTAGLRSSEGSDPAYANIEDRKGLSQAP